MVQQDRQRPDAGGDQPRQHQPFLARDFKAGTVVEFDRFTAGANNLHQLEAPGPDSQRTAVLEIQTRRVMYLGRSDRVDDTAHLLPRGMQLRVVGSHTATYQRPDGSTGQRQVIQLLDLTDTATSDTGTTDPTPKDPR